MSPEGLEQDQLGIAFFLVTFMSFSLIVRSMGSVLGTGSSCVCTHDVVIGKMPIMPNQDIYACACF